MEKENILTNINLVVGLIIIVLSVLVIIFSNAALLSIMGLFSIAILFIGIGRLYNAFSNEKLSKLVKALKFITGVLAIILSIIILIVTLIEPVSSILLLINLLGYMFIIIGVSRIAVGILVEDYSNVYRVFLALVGIFSFFFAFIVLLYPTFGYFVLVILLSLSLLINGLARVLFAVFERK